MSPAKLLYGEAQEVSNILAMAENVSLPDVVAALSNAMARIAKLEEALERAELTARKAANDASCLANGIIPD